MASFQLDDDKENCCMPYLKEKSVLNGDIPKQPLVVIGGNEKNNGNVPSDQMGFRGVTQLKLEQLNTFSVYEDDDRSQLSMQGKILMDAEVNEGVHKEFAIDEGIDLHSTSLSSTDVQSPLSMDLSMGDVSHIDDLADLKKAANAITEEASQPINDRQRFFEVVQYQYDILEHFRESEKNHRPKSQYMLRQANINHAMRTTLVDWLVEVADEYKMDTETLYLSVSYVDRFLSQMSVQRSKLQLVGIAAMYIASKYEEIYLPSVEEFVCLTDNTYTKTELLRMENVFLKVLSFQLSTPTAYVFINTYAVMSDMPEKMKHLTLYISELALLDGETYIQFLPSMMSSASLALARRLLEMPMWTPQLEEVTTYTLEHLKHVILQLCKTHKTAKGLTNLAVREKYNRIKFNKVASIEPIELDESMFIRCSHSTIPNGAPTANSS